ncbi:hypothetical protein [uncultured Oscillibacter sp.]|uniref:hypothetical protein n=1 Tax=uncultured Oscillibacter sp. TaxID=876091 RepID=UPI00280441CA|nr:hypothetical protein [uncultured Oscillibacter sp.]
MKIWKSPQVFACGDFVLPAAIRQSEFTMAVLALFSASASAGLREDKKAGWCRQIQKRGDRIV